MPLIVQPDGTVAEGNIPIGGTKVLVLFDGQIQEAFVSQEAPVSSGEVTRERLQYDNLTVAKKAIAPVSAVIRVQELQKKSVEMVTAAFAAELTETAKKAIENLFIQFSISEVGQKAFDKTSVVGSVLETNQKAVEKITSEFSIKEIQQKAAEDISNTVTGIVSEINQKASDNIETAIVVRTETNQKSIEAISNSFAVFEIGQKATEDISNTVTGIVSEINQKASDNIETAIVARIDENKEATDLNTVLVNYTGYANQNVSTTGWANPANALGDTTTTASTLTATATGLAGTTSVTTSGTITLGLENPSPLISDLNISGLVTIEVERQITGAGTLPLNQSHNIVYEYQISGAAGGTIGSPTTTPPILIDVNQSYSQGCVFSGIRLPSANGTSNVTFVSGFIDADTGVADPGAIPITNGQQGDLILFLVGGNSTGRSNFIGSGIIETLMSNGYTELFTRTSSEGAFSSVFYKFHGANAESTPSLAASNWSYTYICFRNSGVPTTEGLPTSIGNGDRTYPSVGANAGDILLITEGGGAALGATNGARRSYASVAPAINGAANNDYNVAATYSYGCAGHYYTVPIPVAGWQPIGSDVGGQGSVAKGFVSVNVPINRLTDIDNLQVRAVGTVVSGTGLGASKAASIFRARVRVNAQKDY